MTTATTSLIIFANKWDGAILDVVAETEKAWSVRNRDNGRSCWIPKAGVRLRKPGVPTYENEYNVNDWFYNKLTPQQQRVLNLLE